MNESLFTEEKLNLFIDKQLDTDEMDAIHQATLDDDELRGRVCQLKAVRELVGYAYQDVPEPERETKTERNYAKRTMQGIAASLLIGVGAITGWMVNEQVRSGNQVASATDVFEYYKYKSPAESSDRRIVLHVTTGDISAVNAALNEAEQLLASYRDAGTPMKLDVVTYKEGINMLRVGVSPYVERIESIIGDNDNVSFYACLNSITKAIKKEGRNVVLMPNTVTNKTAMELISERIDKGWVYIKV
jgi:intracellular sulfur oxidation DsrE/DsrF family protein